MNLGARPRGVGFPCATAGSVVSAQDAYYGDIVAERELTCGCQSLEKEFAFASTGANAPETKLPSTDKCTGLCGCPMARAHKFRPRGQTMLLAIFR